MRETSFIQTKRERKHYCTVWTVLSPLFSRKIVEIERSALWVAILDECHENQDGHH